MANKYETNHVTELVNNQRIYAYMNSTWVKKKAKKLFWEIESVHFESGFFFGC